MTTRNDELKLRSLIPKKWRNDIFTLQVHMQNFKIPEDKKGDLEDFKKYLEEKGTFELLVLRI